MIENCLEKMVSNQVNNNFKGLIHLSILLFLILETTLVIPIPKMVKITPENKALILNIKHQTLNNPENKALLVM